MATIQDLNVELIANSKGYIDGLERARAQTKSFSDRAGKLLGGIGKVAAAGAVVGVGAAGAAVAGFAKTLDSLTDTEQQLRPAIERSRIAAESLQVLAEAAKRAGSEDGLEAIVDSSQELQLQLGELALVGAARAEEALAALGLEASRLQAMNPEEAFRLVVQEIQKIPNVADRAIAAEEIFGGTSEKLAGIINLTTAEFANLEAEVIKTSDVWSGEALENAKIFDQEMQNIRTELGRGANAFVAKLLPAINETLTFIRTTGIPTWQQFKAAALEPVTDFITGTLVPVFGSIFEKLRPIAEEALPKIQGVIESFANFLQNRFAKSLEMSFISILPGGIILKGLSLAGVDMGRIFSAMGDVVTRLFDAVQPLIPLIGDVFQSALVIVAEAVKEVWTAIQGLVPILAGIFSKVLTQVIGIFMDLIENIQPLIPLIADVLVDLIRQLAEWWLFLFQAIQPLIPLVLQIIEAFAPLVPLLATLIFDILQALIPLFIQLAVALAPLVPLLAQLAFDLLKALVPLFVELVQALLPLVPVILELAAGILPPLVAVLVELIEALTPLIVLIAEGLVFAIQTTSPLIVAYVDTISKILVAILELRHGWDSVWSAISRGFAAFVRPITSAIETVIAFVDRLKSAISSIKLPDIKLPNIKIPGFAEGVRNFEGGFAVVGEKGPELLRLPRGTDVLPMTGMGAPMPAMAGGGDTYVFNFPNYIGDKNDLKRFINEARTDFRRRGN